MYCIPLCRVNAALFPSPCPCPCHARSARDPSTTSPRRATRTSSRRACSRTPAAPTTTTAARVLSGTESDATPCAPPAPQACHSRTGSQAAVAIATHPWTSWTPLRPTCSQARPIHVNVQYLYTITFLFIKINLYIYWHCCREATNTTIKCL